jgi:hypothetical protein
VSASASNTNITATPDEVAIATIANHARTRPFLRDASLAAIAFVAICAAVGTAGILIPMLQRTAFAAGACSALDMVATQGRLSDIERRRAQKLVASPSNPVWQGHPISHAELLITCKQISNAP